MRACQPFHSLSHACMSLHQQQLVISTSDTAGAVTVWSIAVKPPGTSVTAIIIAAAVVRLTSIPLRLLLVRLTPRRLLMVLMMRATVERVLTTSSSAYGNSCTVVDSTAIQMGLYAIGADSCCDCGVYQRCVLRQLLQIHVLQRLSKAPWQVELVCLAGRIRAVRQGSSLIRL